MATLRLALDDAQLDTIRRLAVALADHQDLWVRQVDLTCLPWLNGRDTRARAVVLSTLRADLESRTSRRGDARLTIRPASDRLREHFGPTDATVVMMCPFGTPEGEVTKPSPDMVMVWLGAQQRHSTNLFKPPTVQKLREEGDTRRRLDQLGLAQDGSTTYLNQMWAELHAHGRPTSRQDRADFSYHMRLARPSNGSANVRLRHLLAAWALLGHPALSGPTPPSEE